MFNLFKLITAHSLQWCAYNNIRASLVLILVSTFGMSDTNAFLIYSTTIALGDINSLVGGYFGDKVFKYHLTWLFGAAVTTLVYLVSGNIKVSNQTIIIVLNFIACSIGISRCNGNSMIYTKINSDIPFEKRNSVSSLLHLFLIIASLIAYSISGFINQKFGSNILFFTSGIISLISLLIFIQSEWRQIVKDFTEIEMKKIIKVIFGTLLILGIGFLSFHYSQIVNTTLWISFIFGLSFLFFHSINKKYNYSVEEKSRTLIFIYYMLWFIIYFIFERQFGMIMPLFLSRHFDSNFFGFEIPITNIMSIFQINIIICSLIFYKMKVHDRISNGFCLLIGFLSSFMGYLILYIGSCFFIKNFNVSFLCIFFSIILFSISDLFVLNRIFAICRTAPKKIHAMTTSVMLIGAACAFHGAKIIANYMAIDKKILFEKDLSIEIYKHGFLLNSGLLSIALMIIIISYRFKKIRGIMIHK